eukprot:TRINITY_DN10228_c0_g1_i8.p2 TRINITY_DN10228_c0_g1~~TRINITY_DN10228_c0_g1_i8.p2  ORF type:complete len:186 (-),score=26.56 TRINITY_DN10228_c0_g1_i8:143-700(-)
METWATSKAAAPHDRKRRRRDDDGSMAGLVKSTAELSLHTARQQRLLSGIAHTVVLLPAHAATKAVLDMPPDPTQRGHVTRWAVFVLALSKLDGFPEQQSVLAQHVAQSTDPEKLLPLVHVFNVVPTYDNPQLIKIQFTVDAQLWPVQQALVSMLVAMGGSMKYGPPPRSAPERAVAKALAALRQ